ncbi:hypothetical protein RFF73_09675, partial [Streptococcus ruminantium]|nr:hypothetical protein [Streptococcus ruminantium]
FLRRILNIYYFNKIVVPQFILDYLLDISWVAAVIVIALLIFFLASDPVYVCLARNLFYTQKCQGVHCLLMGEDQGMATSGIIG